MSLRKPSTLEQYISETESKIQELADRKRSLNEELSDVKAEMKESIDNIDSPDLQAELTRITSTREVVEESITDRQQELEQLQAELKQSLAKQKDEENFNKAVKLAQKAENHRQRKNALIKKFNEVLTPIVEEMADIETHWEGDVRTFMRTLKSLEPSFKSKVAMDLPKDERRVASERRNELLSKVEEEAGVSTAAARLEQYVWSWREWQNLHKGKIDIENSRFAYVPARKVVQQERAAELERKKRDQKTELQKQAKENGTYRPHPKSAEGVKLAEKEAAQRGRKKKAAAEKQQRKQKYKNIQEHNAVARDRDKIEMPAKLKAEFGELKAV